MVLIVIRLVRRVTSFHRLDRYVGKPHVLGSGEKVASIPSEMKSKPVEETPPTPKPSKEESLLSMGFSPVLVDTVIAENPNACLEDLTHIALTLNDTLTNESNRSAWDMAVGVVMRDDDQERRLLQEKTRIVDTKREKTRGDIAREIRIQEAEKRQRQKKEAEKEKERLMAQFNSDHHFQPKTT